MAGIYLSLFSNARSLALGGMTEVLKHDGMSKAQAGPLEACCQHVSSS